MPKMIIIECSDEEADRMVEQLKNMIAEYEYHPYSSFPTATRCAGLAVGGPPCGRHFSRLRNIEQRSKFGTQR